MGRVLRLPRGDAKLRSGIPPPFTPPEMMHTQAAAPVDAESRAAELSARYLEAQLAGDRAEAIRLILEDGLGSGLTASDIYLRVIQPAQYELGRRWQHNEISVAQEHVGTAISQLAVAQLYRHLPRSSANRRRIMVTCVAGEQHELGARMAADFLEMAGFDVRFLGANVPTESLTRMVTDVSPDLLVVSAATTLCFPALRDALHAVRAVAPALPILVGGRAFTWTEGCEIPAEVHRGGADADALVSDVSRLLGL